VRPVAIKVEPTIADLAFEATFPEPDFQMFADGPSLLHDLFKRLAPRGLRLNDLRFDIGSGSAAERPQVICHLFNYLMTIKVGFERVEVVCSQMPSNLVEPFKAAILDALLAVRDHRSSISFSTFVLSVALHTKLEGVSVRDYLARFAANVPEGLGPPTGNGAAFYFGPDGDRLLTSVTIDVSTPVADGLFIRVRSVWDGKKVALDSLLQTADGYTRNVLQRFNLQLPT